MFKQAEGYRTGLTEDRHSIRFIVHEGCSDITPAFRSRLKHEALRLSPVSHDRFCAPVEFDFKRDAGRIICPQ